MRIYTMNLSENNKYIESDTLDFIVSRLDPYA